VSNFVLIIFCLLAGILGRRFGWVPKDGYKTLNAWVLYFGLPALSFRFLPYLKWDEQLLFTMVAPLLVLLGSVAFFYVIGRLFHLSKRTSHTLMLVAGLSNTSFVGFPLIQAYYGADKLPIGIVSDQTTFFLLSTIGVIIAVKGSLNKNKQVTAGYMLKRALRFPPLVGCVLALTVPHLIDIGFLDEFFVALSSTISPIALFSIGLQLSFGIVRAEMPHMLYAALYKLVIGPALVTALALLFGQRGEIIQVSLFEMAMPSLVGTSIVLHEFKLNTKIGNSVIGLTIPLGLLTSYLWFVVFETFFM